MEIEKLDLDVRSFNQLKRNGINTTEEFLNYPDKDKLRRMAGEKTYAAALAALQELPIPQTDAEEIAETFNYAVLSAELGDYLRHKEEQLKNEYMSFTANCGRIFAEAQEKLAKHGFGENNGVFEKWITSMGFSKKTVYRMMDIFKFRSCQIDTNEGKAFFDTLPKTLQYDISAKSAPPELVEQVMNGDITTHKEYIELKKQLEEANEQLEQQKINNQHLSEANDRIYAASKRNREDYDKERLKALELQKRVEELESRPVEVAVEQDTAAIAERDERIAELEEQLRSRDSELDFGNNNASCDKMSEFYEMLHGKALNALKDCMAFIRSDDLPQIVKNRAVGRFRTLKDLIEMYIDELEEI